MLQFRTLATAVENVPRNYIKIEENKAIQKRYFNFLFSIHESLAEPSKFQQIENYFLNLEKRNFRI